MKNFRMLKSFALLLVFAFMGNAFASIDFPRISGATLQIPKIVIGSVDEWKSVPTKMNQVGSSAIGFVVELTADIDFGEETISPWNLKRKNFYLDGRGHSVSGSVDYRSPLYNAGDTVYLKDVVFKDLKSVVTDEQGSLLLDTAYNGLILSATKVKKLYLDHVTLDNVIVKRNPQYHLDNFGVLTGFVDGDVYASNLKATNMNIDTVYAANIGGLFGKVAGSVNFENVEVGGKIVSISREQGLVPDGMGVGGIVGTIIGGAEISGASSNMNMENKAYAPSFHDNVIHTIHSNSGIGGIIGKMKDTFEHLQVVIQSSSFTGSIMSSNGDSPFEMGVGGVIGLAQEYYSPFVVNNVSVKSLGQINHNGTLVYMGGIIGAVDNLRRLDMRRASAEVSLMQISNQAMGGTDGGALGGLIGAVYNTDVYAKRNTASSRMKVNSLKSTVNSKNMSVGGAIGGFWDGARTSLTLDSVLCANNIALYYDNSQTDLAVGGLVGDVCEFSEINILKSEVFSKKTSSNETLNLIDADIENGATRIFHFGGMIGFAGAGGKIFINKSTASGKMDFKVEKAKRAENEYIGGLIGLAENEIVEISDFSYTGDINLDPTVKDLLPDTRIIVRGVMSRSLVANQDIRISNGFVLSENIESVVDEKIDLLNVLLNNYVPSSTSSEPVSPAYVYSLNGTEKIWYFDGANVGLTSLCEEADKCLAPGKIVFRNPDDASELVVYSDKQGEWNLKGNGDHLNVESDLPAKKPMLYSNNTKILVWKDENKNIAWNGTAEDGLVFKKMDLSVPVVTFNTEMTKGGDKILAWNGSDFNISKSAVMPEVVFEHVETTKNYFKSNAWFTDEENSRPINDVDVLNDYIVTHVSMDTIKLVVDELSQKGKSVFQRMISFANMAPVVCRMKVLGQQVSIVANDSLMYLPEMTELTIDSVGTSFDSVKVFIMDNGKKDFVDVFAFDKTLDMSKYPVNASIAFEGFNIPISSDSNSDIGSSGSSSNSTFVEISSSSVDYCPDSIEVSNVEFLKSGKSAAKFSFKIKVAKSCKDLTPSASVTGPDGFKWDSSLVSATKSYNFKFYPLNPGTYKFKIQLTAQKDTSFMKTFKADMSVNGHKWSLAAAGSWPKGTLKNDNSMVYKWDQETLIGDYWQYSALPDVQDVVEDVGYWIYSEKNLEFSLDVPLKKAESDSISWDLKKNFNGWNLIANPYSWDLEATSVKNFMDPESKESPFWRVNSDGEFEVASVLSANEAFWVSTDKNRTIKVSTQPVFPSAKASKKALKKAAPGSWSMALVAKSENGTSDSWNVLGVGSQNIELEEPPAGMGDFVSVSFEGEGNKLLAKRILAQSENEYSWNVNLKASEAGKVTLSLDGLDEVRSMGYKAVLVMDGESFEFGNEPVSVDVSTKSRKALLKVVPADVKVVAASGISNVRYSVAAGDMNVLFSVPFGMAGREATVRLVDVNGKAVSMVRGKASAGMNAFSLAAPVRNGVYMLQVRVGSDARTVRLAL